MIFLKINLPNVQFQKY